MSTITNVVVLMLENRSYDNVLGALSLPTPSGVVTGQTDLNGLTGTESNPLPVGTSVIAVHSTSDPVQIDGTGPAYAPTCLPLVDPGEPFNDMAQQFLGLDAPPTSNPYADYLPATTSGLMQGFVKNYAGQSAVPEQNVRDIMNYLTPEQLPVMTFLARHFGVCDQWFASVPTQTFANRTFAVLAAPAVEQKMKHHFLKNEPDGPPYSYIDDKQYASIGDEERVASTSIYEQLDQFYPDGNDSATAPNWRIYFHDYPINLLADPYAFEKSQSDSNENICLFDTTDYNGHKPLFLKKVPAATFVSDVQSGLPKFSFIEPRYNMHTNTLNGNPGDLLPNCDHPGQGNIPFPLVTAPSAAVNAPIDAASGELLLLQVYNLLRSNKKQWPTTLFIVTFDEPGGTYDHVAPPLATPPGSQFPTAQYSKDAAADGFNFNVFGGRVPAIIISPMIEECSTIRATRAEEGSSTAVEAPFDHTSIIATVFEAFGLTENGPNPLPPLTDRDAAAPSLIPFCTAKNTTGLFSGPIVCAPSALVFRGTGTVMMFASAGAPELSATMNAQPSWLTTFTPSWNASTYMLTIVVGVDAAGVSGLQTATFEVSGNNLKSVTVTVTLDPS